MKLRKIIPLLTILMLAGGCDQLQTALNGEDGAKAPGSAPSAAAGNKVLATVNGTKITQDVYDIYAKSRKQQGGETEISSEKILEDLVSLELMRQEGLKKGIPDRAEFAAMLEHQNRQALATAAINDFLRENQPSDEEALETYNMQMGSQGKEFNARHILLKTPEEAAEVITQLDGGADFSELAIEKSAGPSGKSGGKLGWFGAGRMVKPFSDAAAALEVGSYTKEPVQTKFGWHVIMLDDTRESSAPPFEDIKVRLKMLMANQKLQKHLEQIKADAQVLVSMD